MKLYNFHCHNTGLRVMSLNVFKENLSEILIPVIQIKHIMLLNLFKAMFLSWFYVFGWTGFSTLNYLSEIIIFVLH